MLQSVRSDNFFHSGKSRKCFKWFCHSNCAVCIWMTVNEKQLIKNETKKFFTFFDIIWHLNANSLVLALCACEVVNGDKLFCQCLCFSLLLITDRCFESILFLFHFVSFGESYFFISANFVTSQGNRIVAILFSSSPSAANTSKVESAHKRMQMSIKHWILFLVLELHEKSQSNSLTLMRYCVRESWR